MGGGILYQRLFNIQTIPIIVAIFVVLLSIAYSAFGTTLNIGGIAVDVRIEAYIRVTGISVDSYTNAAISSYEEYNVSNISMGVNLPNSDSTITYKVDVTNFGNVEMGIFAINNLPSNLEYELSGYTLQDKLCNNNQCSLGIKKEFYITIKYKDGGYNASNTTYALNLDFDFRSFYTVTYADFPTDPGYPKQVISGGDLTINFIELIPNVEVKVGDLILDQDSYTFDQYSLYLSNVTDNILITYAELKPVSFAKDSWEIIAQAIKDGNTSVYNVGDTKEVTVEGYTNGSEQTFTVRIVNMSTPEECNSEGFSQTACGFVVEFVDIITEHNVDSTDTTGRGWPGSEIYSFVNEDIYNALPSDLRSVIIDTYTVSGYGPGDSSNFTSTDKLYLLSPTELFGISISAYIPEPTNWLIDTAEALTRQLDYYNNNNTTSASNNGESQKKFQGSRSDWWLRTPYVGDYRYFYYVDLYGKAGYYGLANTLGVAPAFRIG